MRAQRKTIVVEELADDSALLQQYGRAVRALLAALAQLAGKVDELETLRAVQRRAQPRLDQLDGDGS
jgi:hypothetical protein